MTSLMKRKKELVDFEEDEHELEIIKAVAQAWHGHSSSSTGSRPTNNEFDAYKRNFKSKPSRFKLEAMNNSLAAANFKHGNAAAAAADDDDSRRMASWDFGQSLWDSYEIVTLTKRLETGLVFDHNPKSGLDGLNNSKMQNRESKNSLRSLFGRVSSRKF